MLDNKMNMFDIVLLIVGIGASVLGFQLIKQVYVTEGGIPSWLMIIAIFDWLTLLVMFILLSLVVDTSKKELDELKTLIYLLEKKKK
ncbi:hypothetical protein HYS31_08430 [Candidatus Woesearchaeota archaeon]|nr:hypothetical protein [Candidatus Woesearchaeota archaeon]